MFTRWHLCCVTVVIIAYFWIHVPHQCIMFAKLVYLILVSFHYNSLIIVSDTEIFVSIDDIPLLKVPSITVSNLLLFGFGTNCRLMSL